MLVYNEFKSVMSQRVVVEQLLPIAARRRRGRAGRRRARRRSQIDYLYEPSPQEIFNQLLPRYVEVQVYRALLESNAAFFAAQMTAMDTATQELGRDDRQPDALHEQGAPGGDHARDHRSGVRRARRCRAAGSEISDRNANMADKQQSARSSRSSARSSTSSSRPATCRRSTTRCASSRDAQGRPATIDVIAEVEQHLGENRVRAVAMKPTDGMQRGMTAIDLGEPISVPVGPGDARPRAERARRAGRLPGSAGASRRSAGRFTAPRRRSRSSRPS